MAVGSGIGASLGFGPESTVGTIASITKWPEFNSETFSMEKVPVQGEGLRGGGLYPRASRYTEPGRNAGGQVTMDLATNGLGLIYKNMLGASTSAVLTGSAYQQIHTPGSLIGTSLTWQKLVPQLDGTLKPFTLNGCKVTQWEIGCAKDQIATLSTTWDAWDLVTTTSAGTPSYSAGTQVFHFLEGSLILGGTASTTSGLTSISGGSSIAGVTAATVTGTTGIRAGSDNRYINGKVEQVQDAWRGIGGTLTTDFISQADVFDLYNAGTGVALKLAFVGTTAITGSTYPTLEIIVPHIRFTGDTPQVGGPGVVTLSASFSGLEDALGNPAVQIRSVTSDSAL